MLYMRETSWGEGEQARMLCTYVLAVQNNEQTWSEARRMVRNEDRLVTLSLYDDETATETIMCRCESFDGGINEQQYFGADSWVDEYRILLSLGQLLDAAQLTGLVV